ncbi:TlyA family RNA methyltransferase [Stomatohabitans albus]|uniref:TlyA family RNA methyltransferase n=1 Tax=Stomatohabitans albus TaxID=3110766 RepID=UPI00300C1C68
MVRQRLDVALVQRKLAASRAKAQLLIDGGHVRVSGLISPKPSSMVDDSQRIHVEEPEQQWVTRGGRKLEGALADLHIDPTGLRILDAGCAHGGFTDVLLTRGASHVYAVDVAYGQFDWRLRTDDRVTVFERTNIRHLQPGDLPDTVDFVVADLSFISLTKVLDGLLAPCTPDAMLLPMVKPQFEVGKSRVGKGGVVRNPDDWADALGRVIEAAHTRNCDVVGVVPSRTPGPRGNIEFFVHLQRGRARTNVHLRYIEQAIEAAQELANGQPNDA